MYKFILAILFATAACGPYRRSDIAPIPRRSSWDLKPYVTIVNGTSSAEYDTIFVSVNGGVIPIPRAEIRQFPLPTPRDEVCTQSVTFTPRGTRVSAPQCRNLSSTYIFIARGFSTVRQEWCTADFQATVQGGVRSANREFMWRLQNLRCPPQPQRPRVVR